MFSPWKAPGGDSPPLPLPQREAFKGTNPLKWLGVLLYFNCEIIRKLESTGGMMGGNWAVLLANSFRSI